MKRRYQIEGHRAVQSFRRWAAEKNPNIQMLLPLAEVVSLLQEGVGHLLREAGLALMNLVMEEEVRQLAGERQQQHSGRRAHRWGKEAGYCVVDGQKVPIRRTRLRNQQNREQRLGSYELFQRSAPLERRVWDTMMRGLSTRNYGAVVKEFQQAYGIEKSAVSENFVEASREKLRELLERPLGELRLCAVLIDGTPFRDRQMMVALGIGWDGRKTVLGLREGATENATVVSELLSDLAGHGLDFGVPRLYVLDGSKALAAAVRRHAGQAACIQRCQVHKRRNVLDHLPEEYRQTVKRKLQNAYGMAEYADAKRALEKLHRELMDLNPSAARSLGEGMEETLTVHRLGVPPKLRRSLASTNVIESAFSIVETVCRNVKRWRPRDQIERWVGSGLLVAERQFRKVRGFREIPLLLASLANTVSRKPLANQAAVRSLATSRVADFQRNSGQSRSLSRTIVLETAGRVFLNVWSSSRNFVCRIAQRSSCWIAESLCWRFSAAGASALQHNFEGGTLMAIRKFAMLGLLFAFCGPLVWAQVNSATIAGTVRDESGAVLPGASVVLTNQDTGISRTVTANAAGRYTAPALSLGNFEATAQLPGFQTAVRSGIVLTVGRQAVVDFTLQVGAVTQTVEVTGEAPLIELTNANLTGLVDDRTIRELPLNGRSYDQLALLQPGIVRYTTSRASFNGGPGGNKFSASGSLASSNSFLLDGTDINDASNTTPGGAAGTNLGVDTIKEFKIVSGAFSAEYGRGSGAVVSAVSRTGTNQVHGGAFEFIRNSRLDARRFRDPSVLPPFRRNQFGGTIGGPIVRDRTFFFAGYEGLREALSQSTEIRVPTPDVKRGILPLPDGSGTFTVDPNPLLVPFLALYPDPQQILPFDPNDPGGLASTTGLFFSAPNRVTRQDYFMGRVDHQLTDSTSIFGRYSFDDDGQTEPDEPGSFLETSKARRQYATIQANTVVSPTLINSFRFALNRTSQDQDSAPSNPALDSLFWVPGQPVGELITGEVNGILLYDEVGSNGTRPRLWTYNLWEWGDDMTYVRGTHTMKFGAVIRRVQNNNNVQTDTRAAYAFAGPENLLLGLPTEWSGTLPGQTGYKGIRNTMYGFYFQDDYQVSPRLTLNLGLRWEWITDPTEANNRISGLLRIEDNPDQLALHPDWRRDLDPNTGYPGYPDNIGQDLFAFTQFSKKNIQPRFGFALQLDDSASRVLRGGFGIYHDMILPAYYTQNASKYPPFYSRARIRDDDVLAASFPNTAAIVTGPDVRLRMEPLWPNMAQPTKYSYTLALQQQLAVRGESVSEGMILEECSCGSKEEAGEWQHGHGNTKTTGTTGRILGGHCRSTALGGASFL